MLDFSRPLELHPEEGDIEPILRECVAVIESMAQERNVTISIESQGDIPSVLINAMKMKQVLINLIMNAVQASPEGRLSPFPATGKRVGSSSM